MCSDDILCYLKMARLTFQTYNESEENENNQKEECIDDMKKGKKKTQQENRNILITSFIHMCISDVIM